jgi:hypothetical protein
MGVTLPAMNPKQAIWSKTVLQRLSQDRINACFIEFHLSGQKLLMSPVLSGIRTSHHPVEPAKRSGIVGTSTQEPSSVHKFNCQISFIRYGIVGTTLTEESDDSKGFFSQTSL